MPAARVVKGILVALVALVLFVVILGGSLWAADYGVQATVVDKDCRANGATVTVQEKVSRFRHTQPIELSECLVVQQGNFVIYNLRSERVRIWDEEGGRLLWDSQSF